MFIDFFERERERENIPMREKHNWLPPVCVPVGDQTSNLGVCPDQELTPHLLVYTWSNQLSHPVVAHLVVLFAFLQLFIS